MRMGARSRRRVDANQAELVKFIRSMGASFQHTHSIPGALDGIIGYRGIDQRVEIKDPDQPPNKRELTEGERETFEEWRGRKPVVIETSEDVTELLFLMTKEAMKSNII